MILILTEHWDRHADLVTAQLDEWRVPYTRFNTEEFPQTVSVSLSYNDDDHGHRLSIGKSRLDLDDVRTVWYRRPAPSVPDLSLSEDDQKLVRRESDHTVRGIYRLLSDRFWVNAYANTTTAEHKPYQLKIAADCGFEIPRTLITNDPEEVEEFFARCNHSMVYKPFGAYRRDRPEGSAVIYTSAVTAEDLKRFSSQVRFAPCIFQERIPKAYEIRATVIGDKIFADRIDAQEYVHTQVDWRRHYDGRTKHTQIDLPAPVETNIRDLLDRMGLVFGCFDIAVTPDGRYVFLEINPNGQWAWVEHITGMPMIKHFAAFLTAGSTTYAIPRSA